MFHGVCECVYIFIYSSRQNKDMRKRMLFGNYLIFNVSMVLVSLHIKIAKCHKLLV